MVNDSPRLVLSCFENVCLDTLLTALLARQKILYAVVSLRKALRIYHIEALETRNRTQANFLMRRHIPAIWNVLRDVDISDHVVSWMLKRHLVFCE